MGFQLFRHARQRRVPFANLRNEVLEKWQLSTRSGRFSALRWKAALGHEDAFPQPRSSARCGFNQETFAAKRGNGRDAPIPAVRRKRDGR
jgi:hypothetical protein